MVRRMQIRIVAVGLLGLALSSAGWVAGQQLPQAVVTDPAADKDAPPAMIGLVVPGHGVEKDAVFYLAGGAGMHGTVLLLHGLPGYEQNMDLAQSIRRAGWNVLVFHYRGSWGTAGSFSLSSAIEDTADAVSFLRDAGNAAKYHIDPRRLVVVGHSFGGFLAGYEGCHDQGVAAMAMISAVNLGTINADPKERDSRLKRWQGQIHPLHGTTAADLFAEADAHAKEWDYVQWADKLRGRPVLLIEADDQNRTDMEALAAALRRKPPVELTEKSFATDHSFSDHRIGLQAAVVEWLQKLTLH